MNFFKLLLFLLPLSNSAFSPSSNENDFRNRLAHALYIANYQSTDFKHRNFKDEIEFRLKREDNTFTEVILSTTKNPVYQVTVIVQILKIAKDKNMKVRFIDLSINHPYATFQNY